MDTSPWSLYGRISPKSASAKQLEQFLQRTLTEYNRSRGYRKIIEDALAPSPGPESVAERLRRLEREAQWRGRSGPGQQR